MNLETTNRLSKLPQGWALSTLGACFLAIRNGITTKQNKNKNGLPVSRIETIQNGSFALDRVRHIENIDEQQINTFRYQLGDLAFSHINSYEQVGKTALYQGEPEIFIHGRNLLRLRLNHDYIYPKYAYLFMQSSFFRQEVRRRLNYGVNQVSINKTNLAQVPFLVAPLNEQQRIVNKLEPILAKVKICQQRLKTIPTILKKFRQSVLAAACSGSLTTDWHEEKCSPEWQNTTLSKLIKNKPRNGFSAQLVDLVDSETSTQILTLKATTSGKFKGEYFKYLDQEINLDSHLWLHPQDILIQRGNTLEYVGVPAIYEGLPYQFIYPDLMMKIQVIESIANYQFIYYVLANLDTRNYLRNNATGTAGNMPKITQKVVMNTPIKLPSLSEQQEIVKRVEALFKKCELIEQRYQKAQAYTDKLTQSIFAKAFRGELVPQDPDDESAEILLAKIRAEQVQQKQAKQSKSKS